MPFLTETLKYVVILIILAVIGGCGAFVGAKLRKSKDKKTANKVASE